MTRVLLCTLSLMLLASCTTTPKKLFSLDVEDVTTYQSCYLGLTKEKGRELYWSVPLSSEGRENLHNVGNRPLCFRFVF
jgi:hypothetical protein